MGCYRDWNRFQLDIGIAILKALCCYPPTCDHGELARVVGVSRSVFCLIGSWQYNRYTI